MPNWQSNPLYSTLPCQKRQDKVERASIKASALAWFIFWKEYKNAV
jgi:hypothetical protein